MRLFLLTLITVLVATLPSGSANAEIIAGSKNLGAIWFVGDSITQGSEQDPTNVVSPRSELYNRLVADGYSFSFTGHHDINPEGLPASTGSTPATNLYDFHSGISGSVIGSGTPSRTGMTEDLSTHWDSGRLATVKPNAVLIMLGTNDINSSIDITNAPGRLSNYIDQIYAQTGVGNPSIFVASIPPNGRTDHPSGIANQKALDVITFNSALPGIVSAQQSLGRDVHFVDQFTPLNDDFANLIRSDNLHPTPAGDASIAQQWFNSIDAISSVPEPGSAMVLGLFAFGASFRRKRTHFA